MSDDQSTTPVPDPNTLPGAGNPFLEATAAAARSSCVAHVAVLATKGHRVTAMVLEILRGPHNRTAGTIEFELPHLTVDVGEQFYVFLAEIDSPMVLHLTRQRRSALRLLAGLTESAPNPTLGEMRALFDSCVALVRGNAVTVDETHAHLEVYETLKGDGLVDGPASAEYGRPVVPVRVGYTTTDPGGPWTFTTDTSAMTNGVFGYFFLDQLGGEWVVLNPTHPGRLVAQAIDAMLAFEQTT